jgi:hypothetical protein
MRAKTDVTAIEQNLGNHVYGHVKTDVNQSLPISATKVLQVARTAVVDDKTQTPPPPSHVALGHSDRGHSYVHPIYISSTYENCLYSHVKCPIFSHKQCALITPRNL